jgi:hypothetical protein
MCTLSFLPQRNGYLLAMNRDELKTRTISVPPALHRVGQLELLYPQEPSGGTWIGANSHGTLLAIMNCNAPQNFSSVTPRLQTRGTIIPAMLIEESLNATDRALGVFSFAGMHPFRLFGIFPGEFLIREWHWNGNRLNSRDHSWIRNHWFSSSRSDGLAEAGRSKAFESSWREPLPDAAAWVRSLHASHIPEAGAFSVCVHREDAVTVSYTEVLCTPKELRMTYQPGNPCEFRGVPINATIALVS